MSRNAILANPEHYIFKIFLGTMPPDPPRRLKKNFFSPPRGSKNFFRIDFPPKQKILDRTLTHEADIIEIKNHHKGKSFSVFWAIFQYHHFTQRHLTMEQKTTENTFSQPCLKKKQIILNSWIEFEKVNSKLHINQVGWRN